MATETYRTASRQLLAQGREELEWGDTRQASEKGWGATAQMVKDAAERRGWEHRSHASLHTAISRLVDGTGGDELRRHMEFHIRPERCIGFRNIAVVDILIPDGFNFPQTFSRDSHNRKFLDGRNPKGLAFATKSQAPWSVSQSQLGGGPNVMMYSGSTLNSTRTSPRGSRNGYGSWSM